MASDMHTCIHICICFIFPLDNIHKHTIQPCHITLIAIFALSSCPLIRHACAHMCTKAHVCTHTHMHIMAHKRALTLSYSLCRYLLLPAKWFSRGTKVHSIFLPLASSSDTVPPLSLSLSRPPSESLSLSLLSPLFHLPTFWLLSLSSPAVSFCHSLFSPLALCLISLFYLHARIQMHTRARALLFLFLSTPPPISWERQKD